jgi:hypothetical protein
LRQAIDHLRSRNRFTRLLFFERFLSQTEIILQPSSQKLLVLLSQQICSVALRQPFFESMAVVLSIAIISRLRVDLLSISDCSLLSADTFDHLLSRHS